MDTKLSDEALIMLYAAGDANAFYTLYDRYKDKLYTYLYLRTKQKALTNDLFQSTWEIVIAKKDYFAEKAKANKLEFAGYLYTIAHHKMVDFFKRADQNVFSLDELNSTDNQKPFLQVEDKTPQPFDKMQNEEGSLLLLEAIYSLPDKQQDVFLLRREGLTFKTIAIIQSVSENTVKTRYQLGLNRLKLILNLGGDDE